MGIGLGCGDKYGLYIYNDLYRGTTNESSTFNNKKLTNKTEF